jgi:pilus assembly protein FimV
VDIELAATRVGTLPEVDLTATAPFASDAEGGLDFVLDEPVRGEDDSSTATTVETPRVRTASSEEPTAEVPIEDLGLDVGGVEGLDEATEDLEAQLRMAGRRSTVEDTVENPVVPDEVDLLSSTSIMSGDSIASALSEREDGVIDLSEATGELPTIETARIESTGLMRKPDFDLSESTGELPTIEAARIESTGLMQKPDFDLGEEAATMSEVGTKLDLARAYIDMGDPEGARSILEEVLKEGNPSQRKEAERLVSGLP